MGVLSRVLRKKRGGQCAFCALVVFLSPKSQYTKSACFGVSCFKLPWWFLIDLFVVNDRAGRLNSAFVVEALSTWWCVWAGKP